MPEARSPDRELETYRGLMQPPTTFRDGFTLRTVMGAFFVGFIMMPGAIYMGLIAGVSLGSAAEWVTIILFSELARRSFSSLTRQEIYVTYYIAGGLAGVVGVHGAMLAGGPFGLASADLVGYIQVRRRAQQGKGRVRERGGECVHVFHQNLHR